MSTQLREGAPFTQVEQGIAESTLTYQLPLAGRFDIDSAVATIDNTGGGDIQPMLYLTNASGEVIAKKRQSSTIPAGDTGTATWALRLADDGGGAASPIGPGKTGFYLNAGHSVAPGGDTLAWTFNGGDALLDLSAPTLPTFLTDGVYGLTGTCELSAGGVPIAGKGSLVELDVLATGGGPGLVAFADWTVWGVGGVNPVRQPLALGAIFAKAGDTLRLQVTNGQAVNMTYDFVACLHKLY